MSSQCCSKKIGRHSNGARQCRFDTASAAAPARGARAQRPDDRSFDNGSSAVFGRAAGCGQFRAADRTRSRACGEF